MKQVRWRSMSVFVLLFVLLVGYASLSIWVQHQYLESGNDKQQRQEEVHSEPRRYYPGRQVYESIETVDENRPTLDSLVQNGQVVGDVQFLLDFVVAGFGKAGTSTIMDWLSRHPSVAIFSREVYDLIQQRPDKLVVSLYQDLPSGSNYIRGFKNPTEITQPHVLEYYRTLWPRTKLIVGLRHPIHLFESLYNFRVQNALPGEPPMPDPNSLMGRCYADRQNTCTEKANYAYSLLRLGKARNMTPLVQTIVGHYQRLWFNVSDIPTVPNPIFLYHMEQFQEGTEQLAQDLRDFLGLPTNLGPLPHRQPGLRMVQTSLQRDKDVHKIDICHPAYRPVRRDLIRIGTVSARWIQEEFLFASPSIHVSDPIRFVQLLQTWSVDPCLTATTYSWPWGWNLGATRTYRQPRPPSHNDTVIRPLVPLRVHLGG